MAALRVTIRNPDPNLLSLFRETAKFNDMTLGECFNAAFECWYDQLEEIDDWDIETLAISYSG